MVILFCVKRDMVILFCVKRDMIILVFVKRDLDPPPPCHTLITNIPTVLDGRRWDIFQTFMGFHLMRNLNLIQCYLMLLWLIIRRIN